MTSPVRALVSPLVAGLLVVAACGTPDDSARPDSVGAVAERLAEQTAAGDHCAAAETIAQLRGLLAQEQELPEASRAKVSDFLTSLDTQLQCQPEPSGEEQPPTEDPPPDAGKDDKPGKGKGRDKGDDEDDD